MSDSYFREQPIKWPTYDFFVIARLFVHRIASGCAHFAC